MAGTKASSRSSKSQRQLNISYVDSGEEHKSVDSKHRRSTRSSRRDRVHPEGRRPSRAMDDDGKQRSKRLTVQAGYHDEDRQSTHSRTPKGVRGSRDLRSPGVKNTPTAQTARLSSSHGMPDFITQTDANGNATTPRSADAINGARKSHPSGRRPKLHVDKRGRLAEDDSDDDSDKGGRHSSDDPCDALFESLRMMCCCFMEEGKPTRSLTGTGQITQDSDDRPKLLGDLHPDDHGKKCLVLDLDETLVHSSFRAVPNADFVIPVQIEDVVHFVYVAKRPGVDEFLVEMAKHYEIVIYTASLNKYADPLLDLLDPKRVIRTRLFRESCVYYEGNYVKDLSLLDRDLKDTIIIDNSPSSYTFHPENAIDCSSFIDDPRDRELDHIGAFLAGIKDIDDVRGIAPQWKGWPALDTSGKYLHKAPLR